MRKKKIYVVSGLGAGFSVLEKLQFPDDVEVHFIPWTVPEPKEDFDMYVKKMADQIDDSEPFYLLGYSFGGIVVQEINKIKHAEKTIILGSITTSKEKSSLIKMGQYTRLASYMPTRFFSDKSTAFYAFFRKLIDPKNPSILKYFQVRDAYYLKWSFEKISAWKREERDPDVIQILGDKDIVFPISKCKPDFIIRGGTHLFPATKHKEVSQILAKILS